MTEKKFILKHKGWDNEVEAEFFEVIIGPIEEVYEGITPENHRNITIRTKRPSNNTVRGLSQNWVLRDRFHLSGYYIPPLIKNNIYLFSYTGKIRSAAYAIVGFEGGELKEFRDITSETRSFTVEDFKRRFSPNQIVLRNDSDSNNSISLPSMSRNQVLAIGQEIDALIDQSGGKNEYEAKIHVDPDSGKYSGFSIIGRRK